MKQISNLPFYGLLSFCILQSGFLFFTTKIYLLDFGLVILLICYLSYVEFSKQGYEKKILATRLLPKWGIGCLLGIGATTLLAPTLHLSAVNAENWIFVSYFLGQLVISIWNYGLALGVLEKKITGFNACLILFCFAAQFFNASPLFTLGVTVISFVIIMVIFILEPALTRYQIHAVSEKSSASDDFWVDCCHNPKLSAPNKAKIALRIQNTDLLGMFHLRGNKKVKKEKVLPEKRIT